MKKESFVEESSPLGRAPVDVRPAKRPVKLLEPTPVDLAQSLSSILFDTPDILAEVDVDMGAGDVLRVSLRKGGSLPVAGCCVEEDVKAEGSMLALLALLMLPATTEA
jgi:hypothetical protein